MKQVYYKQNEKFEYEFFNDKECKEAFKFETSEVLYVELKNGDISPLMHIYYLGKNLQNLFIPYLPFNVKTSEFLFQAQSKENFTIHTFLTMESLEFYNFCKSKNSLNAVSHITPNYSKYIPKECTLFNSEKLNERIQIRQAMDSFDMPFQKKENQKKLKDLIFPKKIMLYTKELTSTNIKQINDTAKVLKEKYGIEWVGVFAELCFVSLYCCSKVFLKYCVDSGGGEPILSFINKLITTNATGLLEPQERELLQVIDCKEIFEEYIKTNE